MKLRVKGCAHLKTQEPQAVLMYVGDLRSTRGQSCQTSETSTLRLCKSFQPLLNSIIILMRLYQGPRITPTNRLKGLTQCRDAPVWLALYRIDTELRISYVVMDPFYGTFIDAMQLMQSCPNQSGFNEVPRSITAT